MHLLDTNICIYLLKGTFPGLRGRLASRSPSSIAVPSVVKAELLLGAYKSSRREATLALLEAFLTPYQILTFGDEESVFYARIRSELEAEGKPMGSNDLLIAAIAVAHGATLVTHNTREFGRVRGLAWEDWTAAG
jgi:tRNA(fMet)-specific endonuclease VapC